MRSSKEFIIVSARQNGASDLQIFIGILSDLFHNQTDTHPK